LPIEVGIAAIMTDAQQDMIEPQLLLRKIDEFESFVEKRLKVDLELVLGRRDKNDRKTSQ
jgi:hypothetical protein